MANTFLKDAKTTSEIIYPLTEITVVMKGTTAQLTNWIFECADKESDLTDNDEWVQCSVNGYDWSATGGQVDTFPCSRGYAYRLRRTTGDAGATATWGHNHVLIWR